MSEEQIEDLPGVGKKTAEDLKENGFHDVMRIAAASEGEITGRTSLGETKARNIIAAAREAMDMSFKSGLDVEKTKSTAAKITTTCEGLDELLGGGVETQSLTEVYGEYGTGKSQMAFQLSVNVQLDEDDGGLGKGCLYIDTESTFVPSRVRQIAEAAGMDGDEVLDNIQVAKAYNSDHQMLLVDDADNLLTENDIGLVVVDSVTGAFRADYTGRGSLAERQQKLNRHLGDLQRIANVYNVAVFVTNQVLSDPSQQWGDPTKASGGHVLHHATSTRMYLRRGKQGSRVCKLVDSPSQPEGEQPFQITENGIEDW